MNFRLKYISLKLNSVHGLKAELGKVIKYDRLVKEIAQITGCKTEVIPYAITWDGIVSKYHKGYRKRIGVSDRTHAYTQYLALKNTLEIILRDAKGGDYSKPLEEEAIENAIDKLCNEYSEEDEMSLYFLH